MTEITYNGLFDLATGRSRRELNWKNKEWLWSDLVAKLSSTHYTAETHTEYMAAKKVRQDEIKDVGGFVGGYLTGGKRKSGSVMHRQLLTLDLDFCNAGFWDDFIMLYGNAAVVYSTHKHSPESPRLRLVMPLDRAVRPDEYEAIARRIAGNMDIELFDPTTFQPERLMYWPSTSKDAVYEFHCQDGEWLCADEVLASYRDWQDSSEWPVSVKVDKLIQRSISKQGDPLEKTGVVGAFCRTFSISEVIETFLTDIYDSCDTENRYTYKEGSTAAGLVVYDDKYVYSHHGTDPTSGKLCNAFDLVRLHKFGLKDEEARENTPTNKLPSYTAMVDFATRDAKVKKALVSERTEAARNDFFEAEEFETLEEDAPINEEWKERLDVDRKGNIYATINNIVLILENDPYFKGRVGYDDFEKCEVAISDLIWRKEKTDNNTRRLVDDDDSNIRHYLERTYGISNPVKTRDAMAVLKTRTAFHPVRDYLNSIEWDGVKRVDSLLIDYQGAKDCEYTRMVIRKMLAAAVARVFEPGIKFDHVLVLVGAQGRKKSSLVAKLGRQWFSDSFNTVEGKESFEQLQGVWLVEMAELSALAKAEVEKIKHFITKRDDRYRVAFGRRVEKFPRQCVFFATTNKKYFLKDPTGDRRYWPVLLDAQEPTKDVFKDLTDNEVAQIWAESVVNYKKGETLYIPENMVKIATDIQKSHAEEHPWTGLIQQYLDTPIPTAWNKMSLYERISFLSGGGDELLAKETTFRSRVCLLEIWQECIKGKTAIDQRSANDIRNIMQILGTWEEQSKPVKIGMYGTQRRSYFRTEIPTELAEISAFVEAEM
ncbi:virulence-associated E family protein [Pedobacter sp.]